MAIKLLLSLLAICVTISPAIQGCSTSLRQHIQVNSSGTDNSSCLLGKYSCSTLAFVLNNLPNCTNISVHTDQILTERHEMSALHNVDISGTGNSTYISISCLGGALTFVQARGISIQGLHWQGRCKTSDDSTVCIPEAVLQFHNSSDTTIRNCEFTSSTNRSAIFMFNMTDGDIIFESSHFRGGESLPGGGVVLVQKESSSLVRFQFMHCSFVNCFSQMNGGAIFFYLMNSVSSTHLLVSNSVFIGNRALYGGHITVNASHLSTNNSVWIYNSTFTRGHAYLSGGAILIDIRSKQSEIEVAIDLTNFTENSANHTVGAVDFSEDNGNSFLSFNNCRFEKNAADFVAAVKLQLYPLTHYEDTQPVTFTNCQWIDHYQYSHQSRRLGCIKTEQVPLVFSGTTLINGTSNAPALHVSNTIITFKGTVRFNKTGPTVSGGAIHLTGMSYIIITRGLVLSFQLAHAVYGGAIFYESSFTFEQRSPYPCVFTYEDRNNYHNSSNWKAKISFEGTHATAAGDSIYLENIDVCTREVVLNVFCNERVFNGLSCQDAVSSPPTRPFIFGAPIRSTDDHTYSMDLMLGQALTFNVSASAVDILGHPTIAIATASFHHCPHIRLNKVEVFVFVEGRLRTDTHLIKPDYPHNEQQHCSLNFQTLTASLISVTVELNITECNLGYVYSQTEGVCKCAFPSDRRFICRRGSGFAYIQRGFWFGYLNPDEGHWNRSPVIVPCAENMCDFSHCSIDTEEHPSSEYQEFCRLPTFVIDQDDQCLDNRGGPYCMLCDNNSASTFSGIRCIPKDLCTIKNTIILALLYLLFLVIVVIFFLSLMKMGLSVGSGYLYAYVYYFTVVPCFLDAFRTSTFLKYFITALSGFVFLTPDFLGLFPLCSFATMNRLHQEVLHYINPLFILSALLVLGFIAKRWPRLLRLPKRYTIRFLCTSILIFFTSLNQTSVNILRHKYFSLNSHMVWYVYIQPNIPFFHVTGHLPFALLAIAVEVLVLFPVTGLLLFEPLLVRWVNFIRIKPFLDNFQACFRDNRRWMAGFYFLGRLVLLLDMFSFYPILFTTVLSVILLFLIGILQPYRKCRLNVIDGFLMLNLSIVGIVSTTQSRSTTLNSLAVHVLVVAAAMYGVVLFLITAFKAIKKRAECKCLQLFKFRLSIGSTHASTIITEDLAETEEIMHVRCKQQYQAVQYEPDKLRESLLSYQSTTSLPGMAADNEQTTPQRE